MKASLACPNNTIVIYAEKCGAGRGARALLPKLWRQKRTKPRPTVVHHVDSNWGGVWRALF